MTQDDFWKKKKKEKQVDKQGLGKSGPVCTLGGPIK